MGFDGNPHLILIISDQTFEVTVAGTVRPLRAHETHGRHRHVKRRANNHQET